MLETYERRYNSYLKLIKAKIYSEEALEIVAKRMVGLSLDYINYWELNAR